MKAASVEIRIFGVIIAALFGMALAAGPAAATTFCVPGFHAACPDSNGNVAQANLETAMKTDASDGIPDRVIVGAMTHSAADSLDASGTDDLEVIGAGPDQTVISTTATNSTFVVYLVSSQRDITMRDLKILVPSTAGSNSVALAARDDVFENVDLETRRFGSQAVAPVIEGSVFRDGRVYGTGMGDFTTGFWTGSSGEGGRLLLEDMRLEGVDRAITVDLKNNPVELRRSMILDPDQSAVGTSGSDITIDTSVVESGDYSPIQAINTSASELDIEITDSTIFATGNPTKPAITATVQPAMGNAGIDMDIDNSIIRGFMKNWQATSPAAQSGIGDVHIRVEHSNMEAQGTNAGDGTTYLAPSNIDADPMFAGEGDYRLTAGSPSIDKGDPDSGPGIDLAGSPWPIDGNGDGTAIRDQGAYEFQPPKGPDTPDEDKIAPVVSKLKLTAPKGKRAGKVRFELSENGKVKITIKPVAKKAKGKKKGLTLNSSCSAGVNTLKLKKGRLKPGAYKVTVAATDAAGNASKTVSGKVTVKKVKKKR